MTKYPDGLLDCLDSRTGRGKKLFYGGSDRPVGQTIAIRLLTHLREWRNSVIQFEPGFPLVVPSLSGPGNGKDKALEQTLRRIDSRLALDGALLDKLVAAFEAKDEIPPEQGSVGDWPIERASSLRRGNADLGLGHLPARVDPETFFARDKQRESMAMRGDVAVGNGSRLMPSVTFKLA